MSIFLRSFCLAILSNTIAFIGIFFFDWNLYVIYFTFWCEMILIIIFTKMAKALQASFNQKEKVSVKWHVLDLWWAFWLFIHFLFLLAFMKAPMKEVIILPDEWLSPATFFPLLILYSLWVPAVLFSVLISIAIHFLEYRKDKMDWKMDQFKGYNLITIEALPYIYLLSNHILIFLGAEFSSTTAMLSPTLAIVGIKTCSDTLIYTASAYKRRM